jgi:hypothetical protein
LTETPAQSDAFAGSIGVDSHFNYTNTPYVTQWPAISTALIGSGIRHIRDGGLGYGDYGTTLATLGKAGIMHDIGFSTNITPFELTTSLALQAPYVDGVEPANEWDSSGDPTWAADLDAEQLLLWSTIRANPLNAGIAVAGPALANQSLYGELGNLDAVSDAGNLHNATCNQNPGTSTDLGIPTMTAFVRESTSKPIWTTETGYNDSMLRPCGLPDAVIAKYDPRTVAERFLAGEPRVYFYQLADMELQDPVFGNTGLIFSSGVPKPQFVSLKSMVVLLRDPGSAFSPQPLSFTISGATQNLHHLLVEKRDGSYFLMLWLEVPSWIGNAPSEVGGNPLTVLPQTITVAPAVPHASVTIFHYAITDLLGSTRLPPGQSSYTFPVTDSISFLLLK